MRISGEKIEKYLIVFHYIFQLFCKCFHKSDFIIVDVAHVSDVAHGHFVDYLHNTYRGKDHKK